MSLSFVTENCGVNDFKCDSGKCIESFRRCDRVSDCANGEDEYGCSKYFIYILYHIYANNHHFIEPTAEHTLRTFYANNHCFALFFWVMQRCLDGINRVYILERTMYTVIILVKFCIVYHKCIEIRNMSNDIFVCCNAVGEIMKLLVTGYFIEKWI